MEGLYGRLGGDLLAAPRRAGVVFGTGMRRRWLFSGPVPTRGLIPDGLLGVHFLWFSRLSTCPGELSLETCTRCGRCSVGGTRAS